MFIKALVIFNNSFIQQKENLKNLSALAVRKRNISAADIIEHKFNEKFSLFTEVFIIFYICISLYFYVMCLNTNVKKSKFVVTATWYL